LSTRLKTSHLNTKPCIPFENFNKAGQSAYRALQTGKKAGIVLILETMKDRKYWIRLNTTIEHFNLPIDTWSIGNTAY
jgi:hypothetical protein